VRCLQIVPAVGSEKPRVCGVFGPKVETAGIEPASAVACKAASTSVAGALISPSTSLAGGVIEGQLRMMSSAWLERAAPSEPAV